GAWHPDLMALDGESAVQVRDALEACERGPEPVGLGDDGGRGRSGGGGNDARVADDDEAPEDLSRLLAGREPHEDAVGTELRLDHNRQPEAWMDREPHPPAAHHEVVLAAGDRALVQPIPQPA